MRVVLLGEAGSSKSALSTFLVWGSRHLPAADRNLEWPHSLQGRVIVRLNLSAMRRLIRSDLRPGFKRESRQLLESAMIDAIGTTMPDWNEEQCKSLYKPLLEELRRYGMVIFDGLDEVLNADDRGLICRTIMETGEILGSQCALLVTARPYVYSPDDLEGFALWRLLPLSFPHASTDGGQVGSLVRKWHQVLYPSITAESQSRALIAALRTDEDRRDMAVRPLLLTLLIGVHHKRRQKQEHTALPRIRVDLLDEATQLMIERWFQRIDRDNNGSARQIPNYILNLLRPKQHPEKSELRRLAEEISFNVQCRRRGETDDIEISRADFVAAIMERLPEIKGKEINSSAQLILDRTALWFPRGHDEETNRSMYAYIHRQFQEFLAACRIVSIPKERARLADRLRTNPTAWREVARLAVVWTARVQEETVALGLVQDLLDPDEDPAVNIGGASKYQALLAAGWALLDLHKAMDHDALGRRQTVRTLWNTAEAYRDGFVKMVCDPEVPRHIRPEAGKIAGTMGTQVGATLTQLCTEQGSGDTRTDPVIADILDVRPGIIPRAWVPTKTAGFPLHIQDFDWIPIERRVWITRYPITWAQYAAFLRSGAFNQAESAPPEYWNFSEKAKDWWWLNHHRQTEQDTEPGGSARTGDRLPNHRTVGISWFDAIAFCCWLSMQQTRADGYKKLALPTLAEWEKALAG